MIDKEQKKKYKELWTYETSDTKACSRCLKIKSIKEFSLRSNARRGLQSACKFCIRYYSRKRQCDTSTIKWLELRDQENKNEKVCIKCLIIKPLSKFYKSKKARKSVMVTCKQCSSIKSRPVRLKYLYGITEEDYENLFEKQNGQCAICGKNIKLVVDHNHETGKIRALLCGNCNRGIGIFQDNPNLLYKAASYLKKHSKHTKKISS